MFRRLLDALDAGLSHAEPKARAEITSALHILLPSLDRHEELDDILFNGHLPALTDDAGTFDQVIAQHRSVNALREEILDALELADECPFERMCGLSRFLIVNLREYLEMEELFLWPHYAHQLDRPADFDLSDPLHRSARVLERQLRRGLASIAAFAH